MKVNQLSRSVFFVSVLIFIWSCKKHHDDSNNNTAYKLSYGDSILYLKNQASDYIVYPVENKTGVYTAFPDGIQIDDHTGAINVSKSETGLRYRITYTAPDGQVSSTMVVISGINYPDKFHYLSQGDSIALPVYNASLARPLPVSRSVFDEGNGANSGGCSVKTVNGQINLAQTVRNGVFGNTPQNNARRDFDIIYRLNDQSGSAKNKITVRVYYYNIINDVAPDLLQTLNDRESQGVFLGSTYGGFPSASDASSRNFAIAGIAKPRPPCVIIIAH